MTGARHRVAIREGIGAATPQGASVSCECGATGTAFDIAEHVRRYGSLDATPVIKVGRIRNAQLTRDRERTHFGLEDLGERVFVLVALPASTRVDDALAAAANALGSVVAGSPEALRDAGAV